MNRFPLRLTRWYRMFMALTVMLAVCATVVSHGLWTGSAGAQSGTTVSLIPSTLTVREGDTAEVTVTVSPAPEADMNMAYTVEVDGDVTTADADADDYTGSGVVTIPAGQAGAESSSGVISISITDDGDIDDSAREVMVVRLTPPTGASSHEPPSEDRSVVLTIEEGVCDRSDAFREAIVTTLSAADCWAVTDSDLSGITELDLTGENIGQPKARDFVGLSGLTTLHLHESVLASLPIEAFNHIPGLTAAIIVLSGESLDYRVVRYLQNHPNLTYLRVRGPALTSLPEGVFDNLPVLTRLILEVDALTSLPEGIFSGLTALTELNMENSGLTSLLDGVFEGLESLEKVYLAGGNFGPDGTEGPLTLQVELEANGDYGFLARVREGAPFAITVNLSVEGGSFPETSVVIPAGNVSSPTIEVTHFVAPEATVSAVATSFPDDLPVENYSGLSVAASDTTGHVVIVAPRTTVTLADGQDSLLEGQAGTYTVQVKNLEARKLIEVTYEVIAGGRNSVNDAEVGDPEGPHEPHEASDFPENTPFLVSFLIEGQEDRGIIEVPFDVPTAPDDVIDDGTQETFTVRLSPGYGYRLGPERSWETTIQEGVCDRTPGVRNPILRELGSTEDQPIACSEATDDGLQSIQYFWEVAGSEIDTLKSRDFIGMTELLDINLDDNELSDRPDGLFADQSKLNLLSFRSNDITELHSDLWEGLDSLEGLLLDSNPLEGTLSADAFAGLSMLDTLQMRDHGYTTLPANVFAAMPMLEDLEMGDGELEMLDPATLGGLGELRYVWMPANNLRGLPDDLFVGISSLEYVNFRDNPGAPFVYKVTLEPVVLEPVAGENLKVRVEMVKATPFDMTVTLSAVGGELSSYSATIDAGEKASADITVTPTDGEPVTVHMESADWDGGGMGLKLRMRNSITVTPSEG